MVERLTVFPSGPEKTNVVKSVRLFRLVVVLSCAFTIAVLLVPGMVSGFLLLLQTVLEALFLPFRLLFDLAVWLTTGRHIEAAMTGLGDAVGTHSFWQVVLSRYVPVLLVVAGLVTFVAGVERPMKSSVWATLIFHMAATAVIGFPLGVCLVPALVAEACALKKLSEISV
ncbi:hypothetical protein [Acetobacter sp.]|uniref:hypothetical protein n=1 Tax=Acetobacter sp. TaxID=440 RepID=UPI0039E95E90